MRELSRDEPGDADQHRLRVLLAVSSGGAVGAVARYAATVLSPNDPGTFAWTVLAVNVAGCAALGLLVGRLLTGGAAHPLARAFLGAGVLGGFTTFSTFTLDAHQLVRAGEVAGPVAYVGLTTIGCLLAALAGLRLGSAR